MKLNDLAKKLDVIFHKSIAMPDDPVGLLIGNLDREINSVLITLDITTEVVKEALEKEIDLIISHHPLIFTPVSNVVNDNPKNSKILSLIENKIAVYAAHTNLDAMNGGLNDVFAQKLGLSEIIIIENLGYIKWFKFAVFVPREHEQKVRDAMCKSGGGNYKNYSCCTFSTEGTGTFLPLEGAIPFIGARGKLEHVKETRIECVVNAENLPVLINAVCSAHPYEEPAYDVHEIKNSLSEYGLARSGIIDPPITLEKLLERINKIFSLKNTRWMAKNDPEALKKKIKSVAVINGSANSLTDRLSSTFLSESEFDAVIVGELRYSNALEIVESGKILIEIGHGESEKLAIDLMYDILNTYINSANHDLKIYKAKRGFIPWRYNLEV